MTFKDPWFLIFIPLFLAIFSVLRRREREPGFIFPSTDALQAFKSSLRNRLAGKLIYLRVACVGLLIIVLARPQMSSEFKIRKDAIGVVLAIDCSSTMLAEDLLLGPMGLTKLVETGEKAKRYTRLDAVRDVAKDFVKGRPDDLIGLVIFAAEAFIACPLTFDHDWLAESLDRAKVGMIKDGTAIGSGILSALNSLKDVDVKSRVVILLSDGINNAGDVPPLVAAKAARSLGVKIYTVGIVSKGQTPFRMKDEETGRMVYKDVRIDINETVLQKIAELTGGAYFRATDMESLRKSYKDIDKLEKAALEEKGYAENEDTFNIFLIAALACLLAEIVLGNTILRKVP